MKRSWQISPTPTVVEQQLIDKLAKKLNYPQILIQILVKRGFKTEKEILEFLHPSKADFCNPKLLMGMDKATCAVKEAIEKKKRITIYGDYDVDGITSVSMMYRGLKQLYPNVTYFIPDRMEDGYGLSISSIDSLVEIGSQLVITVDCGVNSVKEVDKLKNLGIDTIITDHHLPKPLLPNAIAILNPKLQGSIYPNKELSGVGVAYKLLCSIFVALGRDDLLNDFSFLSFVALGTISDIVPLTIENRAFVHFGFKQIKKRGNIGIDTFVNRLKLREKKIKSTDVVFGIAPRLNSTGRMAQARIAVELLTTNERSVAESLFNKIEKLNSQRRGIELSVYNDACYQIENKYQDLDKMKCIVLSGEDWHPGVVGIVASKLVEKYYRPAFLFSEKDGVARASCRSIPDLNIIKAIGAAKDLVINYGGHKYAAGVSLLSEYLEQFETKIYNYIVSTADDSIFKPKIKVECEIELNQIDRGLIDWLKKMAPFGPSNHKPNFISRAVRIDGYPRLVGQNSIKFRAKKGGGSLDLIGFNMIELYSQISRFSLVDIVYSLDINIWRERENIQGYLKDVYLHKP